MFLVVFVVVVLFFQTKTGMQISKCPWEEELEMERGSNLQESITKLGQAVSPLCKVKYCWRVRKQGGRWLQNVLLHKTIDNVIPQTANKSVYSWCWSIFLTWCAQPSAGPQR